MHYDFVDIGTSNFDYSTTGKVLLVEPIEHYLNSIPDLPNITKANFAIGKYSMPVEIYYIPENVIIEKSLPTYFRGCNSIGKPHNVVLHDLRDTLNVDSLIINETVEMISFPKLCELYKVTSIGTLKIDTEGYEYQIIQSVLESTAIIDIIDIEMHKSNYTFNDFMNVVDVFVAQGYSYEKKRIGNDVRLILKRN